MAKNSPKVSSKSGKKDGMSIVAEKRKGKLMRDKKKKK